MRGHIITSPQVADRFVAAQREAERNLIRRARERGGRVLCGQGDTGAALRLTERGVGHWEQTSPFVFTFVLHPDFMVEACGECGTFTEHGLGCPEGPSPVAFETMKSERR